MKVACLWSAGKDSCFAGYIAKQKGHQILALFNFTKADGKSSLSHGLSREIIRKQAEMTGIPIVQKAVTWGNYRREFKKLVTVWKDEKGIEGVVFGDIYLEEHREWIDQVCRELKVEAIFPLWGRDTGKLILEIIDSGFESIIVSVKDGVLGKEWLGRKIDKEFIRGLDPGIDPCGEKGEFHTFVYNGPLFRKPLDFVIGKALKRGGHWFLDIYKGYN